MFQYQKTNQYFAQCHTGFEDGVVEELRELGARNIKPGFRGVYFTANQPVLYGVNYNARLIIRVLAPLVSFSCKDRDDLYQHGRSVEWNKIFSTGNTFGIFANVSGNPGLSHSQFAAQCLKDAVADYFRTRSGKRPNVDLTNPDVWISLFINRTSATISLDTSGGFAA